MRQLVFILLLGTTACVTAPPFDREGRQRAMEDDLKGTVGQGIKAIISHKGPPDETFVGSDYKVHTWIIKGPPQASVSRTEYLSYNDTLKTTTTAQDRMYCKVSFTTNAMDIITQWRWEGHCLYMLPPKRAVQDETVSQKEN